MLTRLKVEGFKNLASVDVRLGPFTCVAGPNGVGKSNLFDAIQFLAALADKPLMEAALAVRGGDAGRGDVASLFHRVGGARERRMRFEVEMLIPDAGEDELGQPARASTTFLRYELALRLRSHPKLPATSALEIEHEALVHINKQDARRALGFPHTQAWRDSVVRGRRTSPYISTTEGVVSLHADALQSGGRPRKLKAASLPRTMLSSANNATEHRTLVLARREMLGWTQLQLEPSALRAPDDFTAPPRLGLNGSHMPATLYALAAAEEAERPGAAQNVYARVANRLSELLENVRRVHVDVDDKRQLLNLVMTDGQQTEHVASALSDGTLRFLALIVMEQEPHSRRLICLEEPENGMHPSRIPAVIRLLRDLAVDVEQPVGEDNPLRQVIINTHSPGVVGCVGDGDVLMAQAARGVPAAGPRLRVKHLSDTWRASPEREEDCVTRGELLSYLNPLARQAREPVRPGRVRAVAQRPELQRPLFERDAE